MKTWLLLLCMGCVACDDDFTPYEELEGLRVLAVRAEPPWPTGGEAATLDALVYAPADETLSYAWSWCAIVGPANDGYPCLVDDVELTELLATVGISRTDLPPYDLGTAETAVFAHAVAPILLAPVCAAIEASLPHGISYNCDGGLPVTVRLDVSTSLDVISTIKVVRLRSDLGTNNENPSLDSLSVLVDGVATSIAPGGATPLVRDHEYEVTAHTVPGASEAYIDGVGDMRAERLLFSWFTEGGGMEHAHTTYIAGEIDLDFAEQNKYTPPKAPDYAGTDARVVVVVRDNRGGVAWTTGDVQLSDAP